LAPIRVADRDDPRLALYRGVRDPDLLRAHRAFIAEGRLVVERLLRESRFRARSVLVTPAAHAALSPLLDSVPCPVYLVESHVIEEITGFNIHRGCLAIGDRVVTATMEELDAGSGPVVCLERVGNPDNVGGVFRNAAAFASAGVVLSPGCSDPLYRKAIRTSMGATLTLPFAIASEWPAALSWLREHGRTVVALTPADDAQDIRSASAALSGRRIVLLLGHEGSGLSTEAQQLASIRLRIPIGTGVDSLSVVSAAAIGLYAATASTATPPRVETPR
jgi:tRNA G18 (ribose-2'-O)-methylase SpoU